MTRKRPSPTGEGLFTHNERKSIKRGYQGKRLLRILSIEEFDMISKRESHGWSLLVLI